jgi:hypothetical protein
LRLVTESERIHHLGRNKKRGERPRITQIPRIKS